MQHRLNGIGEVLDWPARSRSGFPIMDCSSNHPLPVLGASWAGRAQGVSRHDAWLGLMPVARTGSGST